MKLGILLAILLTAQIQIHPKSDSHQHRLKDLRFAAAVIVSVDEKQIVYSDIEDHTTNNKIEMVDDFFVLKMGDDEIREVERSALKRGTTGALSYCIGCHRALAMRITQE